MTLEEERTWRSYHATDKVIALHEHKRGEVCNKYCRISMAPGDAPDTIWKES